MKTRQAITLAAAVPAFGASLILGLSNVHANPIAQGIRDGIQAVEDSPQWSCVDDGNRVCGPNNAEGQPAACYDDGGVIVAYWPCSPWKSN